MNYRVARLTKRQRAMLDFAVKLTAAALGGRGRRPRAAAPRRLHRPRHLGHRGGRRLLQHVEPRRLRHRHAAERGLSRPGAVDVPSCSADANRAPVIHVLAASDRLRRLRSRLRGMTGSRMTASSRSSSPASAPPSRPRRLQPQRARRRFRRSPASSRSNGMVVAQEQPRRAHRRRDSRPRRQRGRCRRRGRLRAGGDLSARRQYRRRRLHGDPSRQAAIATSRSTIARPRRRRRRRPCFSTRRAMPIRRSRATPALAVGVPGTVAGLALARRRNTAPASSRSPT